MISPGKCTSSLSDRDQAAATDVRLVERPHRREAHARATRLPELACLIVSSDPLRQMMFGQTAERTGWRAVVCADFVAALEHVASGTVGAALVDIATPADSVVKNLRFLVQRLAENKELLTVVCGRTNDRLAEIWARELGVWAHLPGVAPESDLDSLLRAARQVVDRLHSQREPTAAGSAVLKGPSRNES